MAGVLLTTLMTRCWQMKLVMLMAAIAHGAMLLGLLVALLALLVQTPLIVGPLGEAEVLGAIILRRLGAVVLGEPMVL